MLCKVTVFVDGKSSSHILEAQSTSHAAEQVCKDMPDAESFCVMVAKRYTETDDQTQHRAEVIRAQRG